MSSTSPRVVARRISDPPTRLVALSGEHDVSTVREVERALTPAVASGDPVIVDLRPATFRHRVLAPPSEVSRLFDLVDARSILVTFSTLRLAVDLCYPAIPRDRGGREA